MNEHILFNFEKFVQLTPNTERAQSGQEAQVPSRSPGAQSKRAPLRAKEPHSEQKSPAKSNPAQSKRALVMSRTHSTSESAAKMSY